MANRVPEIAGLIGLVLGAATVTLHGKPTKDHAFGTKVESAMDLVRNLVLTT